MRKIISVILALLLFFSLSACGSKAVPEQIDKVVCAAEITEIGEGGKEFYFYAIDAAGNIAAFLVHSDSSTVGDALYSLGLIDGENSSFGMYVKTVNGITADYDKDGCYWAFYIGNDYAQTGVDSTEITEGASYTFKIES